MQRSVVLLLLLSFLITGQSPVDAQATQAEPHQQYADAGQLSESVIAGFSHPESVIQSGHTLYVSNIGVNLDPAKKDGDGFISKVDLATGTITDLHFLPVHGVLHAPKGMAIQGNILYVADIDHILGFDVVTREIKVDLPIEETGFLNDLVSANGKLYASATDNGKLFEIDPQRLGYRVLSLRDTVTGANGLAWDAKTGLLYCVGLGSWKAPDGMIYAIDPVHGGVERISTYKGYLDGAELTGNTLYFSDWKDLKGKGELLALDLRTHEVNRLDLPAGRIAGPADFALSKDGKFFIIPATMEGKVYITPLR